MNILQVRGATELTIPDKPCIYFLTDSHGEVLYVGKSKTSTLGRISAHKYEKQFNRAFFILCNGFKEMDEREAELIKKFKPRYNFIIPTGSEAKGLLKDTEIKKIMQVDRRIIRNAANKFDIPMITIGCRRFYDKKILEAIKKYLDGLDKKPLSYRPEK